MSGETFEKYAIGIDIGGTNTKLALVDRDGNLSHYSSFPTEGQNPSADFIHRVSLKIKELIEISGSESITGIGIGAPNAKPLEGAIVNPPNLSWKRFDLVKDLQTVFPNLVIKLENDANVAAYGEAEFGLGEEANNFIVVTLGTGIGTGIFTNGQLMAGSDHTGAEGGHITIIPDGRLCNCGGKGHFEAYASVTGIKNTAREVLGKDYLFRDLVQMLDNHEQPAIEIFNQTIYYLSLGLSSMATLFLPDRIILTGGVSAVMERFLPDIQKTFEELIFPSFKGRVPICLTQIENQYSAILGGASLVFRHREL
jgi:glucokinase